MPQKNQKNSFKYIAFEGIDGSGKTTQAKLFADYLKNKGMKVFTIKEPGGSTNKIRELLLHNRWNIKTELFLFLADRATTISTVAEKLRSNFVISDRSMYSTLAYQGYGYGLDTDFLHRLNLFATDYLKPDIVFCININIKTMRKRLKKRDEIESRSDDFFLRVIEGYKKLSLNIKNFFLIDGEKEPEAVFNEVLRIWKSI